MRLFVALALAACALAGCRESLVEPEPFVPPPQSPPAAHVERLYIKGTPTLQLFERREYRAQAATDAVRYEWVASGYGDLQGTPEDDLGRIQRFRAVREGTLTLIVRARNAVGRVVGEGRREVEVVR